MNAKQFIENLAKNARLLMRNGVSLMPVEGQDIENILKEGNPVPTDENFLKSKENLLNAYKAGGFKLPGLIENSLQKPDKVGSDLLTKPDMVGNPTAFVVNRNAWHGLTPDGKPGADKPKLLTDLKSALDRATGQKRKDLEEAYFGLYHLLGFCHEPLITAASVAQKGTHKVSTLLDPTKDAITYNVDKGRIAAKGVVTITNYTSKDPAKPYELKISFGIRTTEKEMQEIVDDAINKFLKGRVDPNKPINISGKPPSVLQYAAKRLSELGLTNKIMIQEDKESVSHEYNSDTFTTVKSYEQLLILMGLLKNRTEARTGYWNNSDRIHNLVDRLTGDQLKSLHEELAKKPDIVKEGLADAHIIGEAIHKVSLEKFEQPVSPFGGKAVEKLGNPIKKDSLDDTQKGYVDQNIELKAS